jgi:hypothetical protein
MVWVRHVQRGFRFDAAVSVESRHPIAEMPWTAVGFAPGCRPGSTPAVV